MPEARDRLSRPVDVATLFARRRSGVLGILVDDAETTTGLFGSPIRQQPPPAAAAVRTPAGFGDTTRGGGGGGGGVRMGRGGLGTPRTGISLVRSSFGTAVANRENTPASGSARRGRWRGRSGVLPHWYPRTPLRDITAITRAIERRRARLREDEGQDVASPALQEDGIPDPSASVSVVAPLEHNIVTTSPRSAVRKKPFPASVGKVPKILLGIANQNTAESECLTPQKKLLNSIDTVEKVVMEELQKLKRTPTAKRAEREKRVKTLMSMR